MKTRVKNISVMICAVLSVLLSGLMLVSAVMSFISDMGYYETASDRAICVFEYYLTGVCFYLVCIVFSGNAVLNIFNVRKAKKPCMCAVFGISALGALSEAVNIVLDFSGISESYSYYGTTAAVSRYIDSFETLACIVAFVLCVRFSYKVLKGIEIDKKSVGFIVLCFAFTVWKAATIVYGVVLDYSTVSIIVSIICVLSVAVRPACLLKSFDAE